jgi:hypothetical protein
MRAVLEFCLQSARNLFVQHGVLVRPVILKFKAVPHASGRDLGLR